MFRGLRERIGAGRKRFWVVLAFCLYGFSLFLLFFVLTFPYRSFEKRMILALESALACRVEVAQKRFLFPIGFRWEGVSFRFPDRPTPWRFERVQAEAELLPLLLSRRGEVAWSFKAVGTEAAGRLQISRRGEGLHFRLTETNGTLALADLYKGAAGTVRLRLGGQWGEKEMGEGDAEFSGEKMSVNEIAGVMLPISPVTFSRMSGRLILKENRLSLEGFSAQGDQADVIGGGNAVIRSPYPGSLLTLAFRVTPKGSLSEVAAMFLGKRVGNEPLQVSVAGTLDAPRVRLNGIAVN